MKVFIEARPKGRPTDAPVRDYVIEDIQGRQLHVVADLQDAIDWARSIGARPFVAKVRWLPNRKNDETHWLSV